MWRPGLFAGDPERVAKYSLSHDGREFLMVQPTANSRHLTLVLNWLQSLGKGR